MLRTRKKNLIVYAAIIGLLVFLHITRILMPFENILSRLLTPLMSGLYSISTDIRGYFSKQTDTIIWENEAARLQLETDKLFSENARLKSLEEENRILREYLQFYTAKNYEYILSNVIARDEPAGPDDRNRVITIDRGMANGIIRGLPVVSSRGIIVGKVADVKERMSQIELVTNEQCRLAATIQNNNRTSGIVWGDLGLTITMNFIPQTEDIAMGDIVVTSGLETNIPRDLLIGRVTDVSKSSNELWQSAIMEPLVDLDTLTIVSVLLPSS